MGEPATSAHRSVAELGSLVEWPDSAARRAAAESRPHGSGRLGDLREWLAATHPGPGTDPPLEAVRMLLLDPPTDPVAMLAADLRVRLTDLAPPETVGAAFAAGAEAVDAAVDSGADLLLLAAGPGSGTSDPGAAVIGLLTGAEPVALLPRGRAAVNTADWIARATYLRDRRRAVSGQRHDPDALLAELGSTRLALCTGVALAAGARRTPLVLDGALALAAAVFAHEAEARAGGWWQIADAGSGGGPDDAADPVVARAVEYLAADPLLHLGTSRGDGIAALLSVPLLRAAASLVAPPDRPDGDRP